MIKLKNNILYFYLLLLGIFIFEGFGLQNGRLTTFFMIVGGICLLYGFLLNKKIPIRFPKVLTTFFLLFLFFACFSVFFSNNIAKSFQGMLLYVSYFFLFIFTYNNQEKVKKYLLTFLITISLCFIIYSILGRAFLFDSYAGFGIANGYQFIIAYFGVHNNIGDFLAPVLIGLLYKYFQSKENKYILFFVLFFPFFLFSYSRSAYGAFCISAIILFWLHKDQYIKKGMKFIIFLATLGFISISFFLITTKETRHLFGSGVETYMQVNKPLLHGRSSYVLQSWESIKETPFVGIGSYNFISASQKYAKGQYDYISESSHNIFLDILVENGIGAFIFFVGIILLILAKSTKNMVFFVFLTMFIDFQTHYTYRIYSMQALFFIIAGLIYRENDVYHFFKNE